MFRASKPSIASYPSPPPLQPTRQTDESHYSPLIKLGFSTLKSFFLFNAGFCVAYVFSASLNASTVAAHLIKIAAIAFVPLVALTFSVIAIVVLLESLR